jgi:hypothetical protein
MRVEVLMSGKPVTPQLAGIGVIFCFTSSPYAVPVKRAYFDRHIWVKPKKLGRKPMYLVRRVRKVTYQ